MLQPQVAAENINALRGWSHEPGTIRKRQGQRCGGRRRTRVHLHAHARPESLFVSYARFAINQARQHGQHLILHDSLRKQSCVVAPREDTTERARTTTNRAPGPSNKNNWYVDVGTVTQRYFISSDMLKSEDVFTQDCFICVA